MFDINPLDDPSSISQTDAITSQPPLITKQEDPLLISTIGPSKETAILLTFDPQIPNLNSTALFSSKISHDIQVMTTEKNNLMITSLLDKWLKDLEEAREEYEKKLKSIPYQYWQEQLSPLSNYTTEASLKVGEIEKSQALVGGLIESVERYKEDGLNTLSIAGIFFAGAALSTGGQLVIQLQAIPEAARAAEGFVASMTAQVATSIKYDFHLELSYMMGLFIVVNQLARPESEQIRASNKNAEPTQQEAESFAKDLLKSLNSGQFDRIASRFWTGKTEKGEPIAKERVKELTSQLRVLMLAMSLSLLAVTNPKLGWMNGQEFKDLVEGKVDLDQNSLEASVVKELAQMQNTMNLAKPGSGDLLIAALVSYFNKNPSTPANLTDFNKFYAAVAPFKNSNGEIPV